MNYLLGSGLHQRCYWRKPDIDRPHDEPRPRTVGTEGTERYKAKNPTTAIVKTVRLGQVYFVRRNTVNRGFQGRHSPALPNAQ